MITAAIIVSYFILVPLALVGVLSLWTLFVLSSE